MTLYPSDLSCTSTTVEPTKNVTRPHPRIGPDCWTNFIWATSENDISYFAAFNPRAQGRNNNTGEACLGAVGALRKTLTSLYTMAIPWPFPHNAPLSYADTRNLAALACNVTYYTQEVNAIVAAAGASVISTEAIGPRRPFSESEFNTTNFENILALGDVPHAQKQCFKIGICT